LKLQTNNETKFYQNSTLRITYKTVETTSIGMNFRVIEKGYSNKKHSRKYSSGTIFCIGVAINS